MAEPGFNGLTVASFESRMAPEMTRLIERHGGQPLVTPALREIPLEDNSSALRFGHMLLTEGVDVLILMTGVGTTTLFEILRTNSPWDRIAAALQRTTLVARGPKPVSALKAVGLHPTLTVPEPNTWLDLLSSLDAYRSIRGLRVAVQEYGQSNKELLTALRGREADVVPVPVYRWALPEDLAPMKRVIREIVTDRVQVLLITNAAQIDHVLQVVEAENETDRFKRSCRKLVVASIGPTASERLKAHGLPVDFEPSHGKMGILVREASMRAREILAHKAAG